jgi:hypothetical protein
MNGKRPPNRNQVFDSNGPGVRVRGNAQQLVEKYLAMARDASSQGDRVLAENCHQHADHYQRVLNALTGRYVKTDEPQPSATVDDEDFGDDEDGVEVIQTSSVQTVDPAGEQPREQREPRGRGRGRRSADRTDRPERSERPVEADSEEGEAPQPAPQVETIDLSVATPASGEATAEEPAEKPEKPARAPRRRRRPAAEAAEEAAEGEAKGGDTPSDAEQVPA